MSWLDKVKDAMIIRTGDGRTYTPKWVNASRSKEYNVAEFEFPNLSGTLVSRKKPKGVRYNIEICFDGEDHLDDADAFWNSADDERPWVITHPFYGVITVEVITLAQDNTIYNVSKLTGSIVETITEDAPKGTTDPVDKIASDKAVLDEVGAVAFTNNVPDPSTTDINTMQANNSSLYNLGKKRVKLTENAEEYFNLFNQANSAVVNITAEPLAAIRAVNAMINYPSLFEDSVQNRVQCLVDQIDLLRTSIENIIDPSSKKIFQSYNNAAVSSLVVAASTPQEGDYSNRDQVFSIIELILSMFDQYLEDLDGMQTPNGGDPDSFVPDADMIIGLSDLIDFSLSSLFDIALNSKQERSIILEDDSNAILLTHRFYGLDQTDVNLTMFIDTNKIGLNELLQIRKGRTIKYYI